MMVSSGELIRTIYVDWVNFSRSFWYSQLMVAFFGQIHHCFDSRFVMLMMLLLWVHSVLFRQKPCSITFEESVNQHFHALIQTRNLQHRRDIGDDNVSAKLLKRWERAIWSLWRGAASFLRTKEPCNLISNSNSGTALNFQALQHHLSKADGKQAHLQDFQFLFGDWFSHPWLKQHNRQINANSTKKDKGKSSPFLPKITMVGVSTLEPEKPKKATLRKTMDDVTKELERVEQETNQSSSVSDEDIFYRRDPLFVANRWGLLFFPSRTGAVRWVRGGSD